MNAQDTKDVILSESDIEQIVGEIREAKRYAKQVPEYRFARFSGALCMILSRIDKRIGDAVWME